MTLRFYKRGRHEASLRVDSADDYHLTWHYKAPVGIVPIMENLQWALQHEDYFTAMRTLITLKLTYDEIHIV